MRRLARADLLLGLGLPALLAACAAPPPSTPAATVTPAPPSVVPSDPATAAASPSPATGGVRVDASLLEVLPERIDGIAREGDAETAAEIAAGAGLASSADAVAVALYVGAPDASAGIAEYAVVTVTRLRPGVYGEAFHRDWRDSFDTAVCEQAGGVVGNAEAEIRGRRTFIGTCAGGVRTYHVVLRDETILVSLQALGDGRLGERIVAGLTE